MEQTVRSSYTTVCSTCLSSDRHLYCINESHSVYKIFRLLMHDFEADMFGETTPQIKQAVCWECLAVMRKFRWFKIQVYSAQEHLRTLVMSRTQESIDSAHMPRSLSSLKATTKSEYDKTYLYNTQDDWPRPLIVNEVKSEPVDTAQDVRNNLQSNIDKHSLEAPESVLEWRVEYVVGKTTALTSPSNAERDLEIPAMEMPKLINRPQSSIVFKKSPRYDTDFMTEADLFTMRAVLKNKVKYVSSSYKCELCIIGFHTQQQVEDHFLSEHRAKPGKSACHICCTYIDDANLAEHTDAHYLRYTCKLCGLEMYSEEQTAEHMVFRHMNEPTHATAIVKRKKRAAKKLKPGDLKKRTIEGYPCLECNMYFQTSRVRKTHVLRCHREGFQCDHCKKSFVNKSTLSTHLKLHEGPLPREECTICHKLVRVAQLKYHIQRHQNKNRYHCAECNKVFAHLTSYQGHLKYSRAHGSESVFKFPCPMCNKGYPTKEKMQDHFNYQHLGKTSHKCPLCDKPIATRALVEKHLMRMHREKKEKPKKKHGCTICGKYFASRKELTQHELIHSSERTLTCDICQKTYKQKASLYAHKRHFHKIVFAKRTVQYADPIDTKKKEMGLVENTDNN